MILDKVGVLADPALRREVVARVLAGHAATPGRVDEAALSAEDLTRRPAPPPEPPAARTRRPPTHPTLR